MAHYEKQDHGQHGEAGDGVFQDLVRPKGTIRPALRLFGGQAVAAEQIDVRRQHGNQQSGQNPGMQRKEARQGQVAVVGATDDNFLKGMTDNRSDSQNICRHFGGPESLLVPGQQIAGQRKPKHD